MSSEVDGSGSDEAEVSPVDPDDRYNDVAADR